MKIKLTILAEDILLDNYFNCRECPITKALARAGYPELQDIGRIVGAINGISIEITRENNDSYLKLTNRLYSMYKSISSKYHLIFGQVSRSSPVKTFTHIINFQHEVQ